MHCNSFCKPQSLGYTYVLKSGAFLWLIMHLQLKPLIDKLIVQALPQSHKVCISLHGAHVATCIQCLDFKKAQLSVSSCFRKLWTMLIPVIWASISVSPSPRVCLDRHLSSTVGAHGWTAPSVVTRVHNKILSSLFSLSLSLSLFCTLVRCALFSYLALRSISIQSNPFCYDHLTNPSDIVCFSFHVIFQLLELNEKIKFITC